AGGRIASKVARSRQRATALRLPTAVRPAQAGRRAIRRQPHLSAVSRGRAFGSQAEGSTKGRRHACADPGRGESNWTARITVKSALSIEFWRVERADLGI